MMCEGKIPTWCVLMPSHIMMMFWRKEGKDMKKWGRESLMIGTHLKVRRTCVLINTGHQCLNGWSCFPRKADSNRSLYCSWVLWSRSDEGVLQWVFQKSRVSDIPHFWLREPWTYHPSPRKDSTPVQHSIWLMTNKTWIIPSAINVYESVHK